MSGPCIPPRPLILMELHVALCCAVPNGRWVEHIPQLGRITTAPMRMEGGRAFPSSQPGLGIEWDWDAVAGLAEPDLRFDQGTTE